MKLFFKKVIEVNNFMWLILLILYFANTDVDICAPFRLFSKSSK